MKPHFPFTFMCLICLTQSERTPAIVGITENQIRNLGSTVELSCSVLYSQDFPVMWMKVDRERTSDPLYLSSDSTPLISDSRFSLRYDKSSTTYTLQIRDIQSSDSGIYKCVIFLSTINYISKEMELSVYSPPLIYDNSSSTIVVSESNPVNLECYAGGTPKPLISWKRENDALLPTGGAVYRGNVLKINSVKKDDRGTYYCMADNKVGEVVKKSIALEVEFPPNVMANRQWVQQAVNYDADLECRVEAFPAPTIVWSKDDITVSNNQHYKITPTTPIGQYRDSMLRVIKVGPGQYGTYLCKAVNKLGESTATIYLQEVDDPVCPPACGSGHYSAGTTLAPSWSSTALFFTSVLFSFKFIC